MRRNAWTTSLLLVSGILLTACGRESFSTVATPALQQYSPEVQTLAADELETMGPACPRDGVFGDCSAVKRLVLDYRWMREQARAAGE